MCFASLCFIAFILPPIRERRDRGTTTREKNIKQRERERCNIQNLSSTLSSWWHAIVNLGSRNLGIVKYHSGPPWSVSVHFDLFQSIRSIRSTSVYFGTPQSTSVHSVYLSPVQSTSIYLIHFSPFWSTSVFLVYFDS